MAPWILHDVHDPQSALPTRTKSHVVSAARMSGLGAPAIPFSRFMELALYAPGLGYYSAGARTFGAGGDFITAPELGPAFATAIASAVAPVLRELGGDSVIGPMLVGMAKSVQIATMASRASELVTLAVLAASGIAR